MCISISLLEITISVSTSTVYTLRCGLDNDYSYIELCSFVNKTMECGGLKARTF